MPLISVIVPVYGVLEYLDDCVRSILSQTHKNLEVILVDDGSTDGSGRRCDFWAAQDPRVRVVHRENGGLSQARNTGLEAASGALIAYVDGDDVIHPQYLEILLSLLQRHRADLSCCAAREEFQTPDWPLEPAQERLWTAEAAVSALVRHRGMSVTVWNKLYRRELLLPFEQGKFHEDEFWTHQVLGAAKIVASTTQALYGYRQREGSIMHRNQTLRLLDLLEGRQQRLRWIESHFPALLPDGRCDFRFECIRAMQMCMMEERTPELQEEMQRIGRFCMENPLNFRDFHRLKPGRQVWCALSNLSFSGTCRLRNFLHYGP